MDTKLVQQFYDRWPKWFGGLTQPPEKSCLAFGFECGDGWFDILWQLCEDIDNIGVPDEFQVDQVKEKFGGLRFYTMGANEEIYNRISQAEYDSYNTCEICGSTEDVTSEGNWITTFCKKCRDKDYD